MRINKFSLLLLLTGAAFFVLPLKAQVNVGSENTPQPFSLLELTTSIQKGGLRLPQLTTKERDDLDITAPNLDAAQGLVIYNTDIDCVEFYNSEKGKWISLCNDATPTFDRPTFDPTVYPNGSGSGLLNGKFCFDIARSNDGVLACGYLPWREKYKSDFTKHETYRQIYTFTPNDGTAVSKVRFYYIEWQTGTGLIVDSLIYDPAYETATNITDTCRATLYYKHSLNASALGRTQVNPLMVDIYAIFNSKADGTGTDQAIKMTATIKDGACCGSKINAAQTTSGSRYYRSGYQVFMCHNLGADESADPFIPAQALHGAIYKWGLKDPALNAAENIALGNAISDWANRGTPPSETTANWNMDTANPCPAGYRVPIAGEFVVEYGNYNTITYQGFDNINWTSGIQIGQVGDGLFLPAAGYRDPSVHNRGTTACYWTASARSTTQASNTFFTNSSFQQVNSQKTTGMPVRCIAE